MASPPLRRLSCPLALALLALAPSGCTRPQREVMLIVSTNIPCPSINRVELVVTRGASSTPTFQRTFALTGDDCSGPMTLGLGTVPLGVGSDWRLGIVDSRGSTDRVRIRLNALGTLSVSTEVETVFVDGKVYAVPVQIAAECVNFTACASGFTCRTVGDRPGPVCGSVYRNPGTLGTFMSTMGVESEADTEVDLDGP